MNKGIFVCKKKQKTLFFSKIFSTSAFMEGIGNYLKRFSSKRDGRPKDHQAINQLTTLITHSSRSKQDILSLAKKVSDYLVDINKGCIKNDNEKIKKRYNHQKGIVMERKAKGKQNKHTIPFILSTHQIRDALHELC